MSLGDLYLEWLIHGGAYFRNFMYHSWYLCQLSLQIVLLPIQIIAAVNLQYLTNYLL